MTPFGNKEVVRGGRPPALGEPGRKPTPPPVPEAAEPPDTLPDEAAVPPNPTAVGFRTEAENCSHCTYYVDGQCQHPLVAQAVNPGDSCAAFEAKGDTGEQQIDVGEIMESELV